MAKLPSGVSPLSRQSEGGQRNDVVVRLVTGALRVSLISSLPVSKWTALTPPAAIRPSRGEIPEAPPAGGLLMSEVEKSQKRTSRRQTSSQI